jgi:Protein of unknown function (DUF3105)
MGPEARSTIIQDLLPGAFPLSTRARGTPVSASERRSARQHARGLQRQRERRRRQLSVAIWVAGAVAIAAVIAVLVLRSSQSQPGRAAAIQGQQHIGKNEQHVAYNTKPATSGPHWSIGGEAPVNWGISKEPIPDEAMIHNLEHGGIAIQYNCGAECPELVSALENFYTNYTSNSANRLPLYPSSTKIVVAPYPDMSTKIALTAWGRIDTMDGYDQERITKFVDAFRDKGPEKVP